MRYFHSRPTLLLAAFSLLAPLSACEGLMGKEVARLPINAASTADNLVIKETSLELKKEEKLTVWSDLDMAYDGEASLRFQLVVLKDGQQFKELLIDPSEASVTMNSVRSSINGSVTHRYSAKNAELTIPENGTYTFKGMLVAAPNSSLKLKKAELVLKK